MKKFIILAILLLCSNMVYASSETQGDIDPNVNQGITSELPCSPASVSNGSVNSITCVITCNSGYTLSGESCVAVSSGGGGGGGGSSPLTTPYLLTLTESDKTLILDNRPLDLSITKGLITRPIEIERSSYKIRIEKGTKITYADGTEFSGEIMVPSTLRMSDIPPAPKGFQIVKAFNIGSKDRKPIKFSPPITLTIPVKFTEKVDPDLVKVYYYDEEEKIYKLVGDGGILSEDQKSIVVTIDHMTIFAVLYGKGVISATEKVDEIIFESFFKDAKEHWAKEYIKDLYNKKVFIKKDNFYPNDFTSRAQLAKIIVEAFDIEVPSQIESSRFTDVDLTQWYAVYTEAAASAGIIKGYSDKTFRPAQEVNRAEAVAMILRAANVKDFEGNSGFTDVPKNEWFSGIVAYAVEKGIVKGRTPTSFAPMEFVTRAEISKLVSVTLKVFQ